MADLTLRHTFNEEIWTISQQNISFLLNFSSKFISYFRFFWKKYPALEFSGKKYTQENGTSYGLKHYNRLETKLINKLPYVAI